MAHDIGQISPKSSVRTVSPGPTPQLFHPTISRDAAGGAGAYQDSDHDSIHSNQLLRFREHLTVAKEYMTRVMSKKQTKRKPPSPTSAPGPRIWIDANAPRRIYREPSRDFPAESIGPSPSRQHQASRNTLPNNGYPRWSAAAPHPLHPPAAEVVDEWMTDEISNETSSHYERLQMPTAKYKSDYGYEKPTVSFEPRSGSSLNRRRRFSQRPNPMPSTNKHNFVPDEDLFDPRIPRARTFESGNDFHNSPHTHQVDLDDSNYNNSVYSEEYEIPRQRPAHAKTPIRASTYRILCEISCHKTEHEEHGHATHPAVIYEDVPQWNPEFSRTTPHLIGRRPVYNLKEYFASCDRLCFIIFRKYSCSSTLSRHDLIQHTETGAMPTVRVADAERTEFNESLEVMSESLEKMIQKVAKCEMDCFTGLVPRHKASNQLKFDSPYIFLYHHRSILSELSKKEAEPSRREVLALLVYLKERQKTLYQEADVLLATKMISTGFLEFLFCPNEIIVSSRSGIEVAYVLKYLHVNADNSVQLHCWAWVYDGAVLKRRAERITVSCKGGNPMKITDLDAYPLRFASDETKTRLLKRGARFWELRTPQLVTYKGFNFLQEKYISEGRCMLDYPTYRMMHQDAEIFTRETYKEPLDYDKFPEKIGKDAKLTEEQMMLCPPNIHGYLLKEKTWLNLLVDNIYPVTWNKDAFKRLVLPHNTKDLVEALIKAHASANSQQAGHMSGKRLDLIAGKGLGLIMLLHGSPGTGKTLTAESVAEIAEMPLYSVTCGDIGVQVDQVEQYLQKVLYLGKTWNCVLLLDEADVFLEERSLSDMKRNSLVSVFLRILEYYEGILILTSNRVGTFDEAFRSRIQLALHYPKLTPIFRKKIWQNFFDILAEEKEDADLAELESHLEELSMREMNGREIRNALTSARQLATYKKITLQWKHLQETLSIGKVFIDYLRDVHGHADEDWAREEQLR